jgi:ATP-dependent DNA helicase DinG
VTTQPEGRIGPRCPEAERCFVARARRRADRADIVVVNHHLFFADLALRAAYPGARVLPEYHAVIFDEAHQLEDIVAEHFGLSVSSTAVAALARDVEYAVKGIDADRLRASIETCASRLFSRVRVLLGSAATRESPRVELPAKLLSSEAEDEWFRLDAALEQLACHSALAADGAQGTQEVLLALANRTQRVRDALAAIVDPGSREGAFWVEFLGARTVLRSAPVRTGPVIARELLSRTKTVIFTSATLTAAGSFDFAREVLGVPSEETEELAIESPFDYSRQALLYLPRDIPAPNDAEFTRAVCVRLAELLAFIPGGAFVLFTTHRALRAAAAILPDLTPRTLLVQGSAPRSALLDRFRSNLGSVLLGTGSFWEGVDVPGPALSLVVIDKLPFAPPDDPLLVARLRTIEEEGRDPFRDYQLPQAVLALKQGFGRLIRRRDDRGMVAICDNRILSRRYGHVFLASLPVQLPRTSSIEQARRWWTHD